MAKDFKERIQEIMKPAVDKGAAFKLIPSGSYNVVQIQYKNSSVAVAGENGFIEYMMKSFSDSVENKIAEPSIDSATKPQPDNIIDMSNMASRKLNRN